MKEKDIKVGCYYSDHKGTMKLVTAEGPEFVLCAGQGETDCIQYEYITFRGHGLKKGSVRATAKYNTTRASFAKWAMRGPHGRTPTGQGKEE